LFVVAGAGPGYPATGDVGGAKVCGGVGGEVVVTAVGIVGGVRVCDGDVGDPVAPAVGDAGGVSDFDSDKDVALEDVSCCCGAAVVVGEVRDMVIIDGAVGDLVM